MARPRRLKKEERRRPRFDFEEPSTSSSSSSSSSDSSDEENQPPPAKKARRAWGQPMEHISQIRQSVGRKLTENLGTAHRESDVEQSIVEVRAILATNAEIFERCMASRRSLKKEMSLKKEDHAMGFVRGSFNLVHVRTQNAKISFTANQSQSFKTFDVKPLTTLPAGLEGVLAYKRRNKPPGTHCIDHEALYEQSLVLHEDVLRPFLCAFKEYLMSVQVCLGDIEAWIIEPREHIDCLESIFGTNIAAEKTGRKKKKSPCMLRECRSTGEMEIKAKFDITKRDERTKLEKMLDLLAVE